MTPNEREHIECALIVAIREQRKYERDELRYTMDSAQVQAWETLLRRLQAGEWL